MLEMQSNCAVALEDGSDAYSFMSLMESAVSTATQVREEWKFECRTSGSSTAVKRSDVCSRRLGP